LLVHRFGDAPGNRAGTGDADDQRAFAGENQPFPLAEEAVCSAQVRPAMNATSAGRV
jgi:hypothetical protein